MTDGAWNAAEMFGRLHPLTVHVPIGLLVLLAFLELAARGRRRQEAALARRVALVVAAAAAVLSALLGWLLSRGGGYGEALLAWHQYAGFATATVAVALVVLDRLRSVLPYRVCLAAACAIMGFASHLGGSLTHGENYLTENLPPAVRKALGWGSEGGGGRKSDVFSVAVRPILEARCFACHGAGKQKGELRMDTTAGLFKGGQNGPVIVPGRSAESRMVKLVMLPEGNDDRMPADGRPGVTGEELAIIRWWIDAGAPTNKTVAELNPPPAVARALAARGGGAQAPAAPKRAPVPAGEVEPMARRLAEELGIIILPLASGQAWLDASAALAGTNFTDAALGRLASIGANVRRLDLSGTAIGDAGLPHLRSFPNLQTLHLARTRVTDAGLSNLAGLVSLESLNLYGTAVSDAGLGALKSLPQLRRVYLWQSKVTANAAAALESALSDAAGVGELQREMDALEVRIRAARVEVNLGARETGAPPAEAKAPESKAGAAKPAAAAAAKGKAGDAKAPPGAAAKGTNSAAKAGKSP